MSWNRWWLRAVVLCITVGLCLALLRIAVGYVALLGVLCGMLAGSFGWLRGVAMDDPPASRRALARRSAALGSTTIVAACGYFSTLPWFGDVVLLVLVCGSPRVGALLVARRGQATTPSSGESALASLSDAQLCHAWNVSFAALNRAAGATQQLTIVSTRAALLDELAGRSPECFSRWLASGPRAAGDPARYFAEG